MNFFNRLIYYFYDTSEFIDDPSILRRIYLLVAATMFEAIQCLFLVIVTFSRGQHFHTIFFFIVTLLYTSSLVFLKKYNSYRLSSFLLCYGVFFFYLFQMLCLGKHAYFATFFFWMPIFYSTFLINKKTGVLFAFFSMVLIVFIEWLNMSGYRFSFSYVINDDVIIANYFISTIPNFILLAFSFWYFESTREKSETKIKISTMNLMNTQGELINTARLAGMSEIATGTLHNIGNLLNSIKTSAHVIKDYKINSSIADLKKANELVRKHMDNIDDFIMNNPKGIKLIDYYLKIEQGIHLENEKVKQHIDRFSGMVNTISGILDAHHSYDTSCKKTENILLSDVIEDALTMLTGTIERYNIKVLKEFHHDKKVPIHKTMLLHILINMIRNARDAMLKTSVDDRQLKLEVGSNESESYVKVSDSGHGILEENIKKMFLHGFTTKESGHGFGLNSCSKYMNEMGGKIEVESSGYEKGTTFILKFPETGGRAGSKESPIF